MLNRTLTHPSVTKVADRLAQIRAQFAAPSFLILPVADDRNGEIYGPDDMPIQSPDGYEIDAPDETPDLPSLGTPARSAEVSLTLQIEAIDHAFYLRRNLEADHDERASLRTQIERWRQMEADAKHCGFSSDFQVEIERAQRRIETLDDNLVGFDLFAA